MSWSSARAEPEHRHARRTLAQLSGSRQAIRGARVEEDQAGFEFVEPGPARLAAVCCANDLRASAAFEHGRQPIAEQANRANADDAMCHFSAALGLKAHRRCAGL
jgi:hypothetical protein